MAEYKNTVTGTIVSVDDSHSMIGPWQPVTPEKGHDTEVEKTGQAPENSADEKPRTRKSTK